MDVQTADAPELMAELHSMADDEAASRSRRFFKTKKGQYGEEDRFLGIRVPVLRKMARQYREIHVNAAGRLLRTPFHEARMLALLILIQKFQRGAEEDRTGIYHLYMDHTEHINSWDLVDASAGHIPGAYLKDRSRAPLYELAVSDLLWDRRIAIVATWPYIRENDFSDTLGIAQILINDHEDMVHKAVGWMLREVGKRDISAQEEFLKPCYKNMPRTMLRYAIEKFPEEKRRQYLKGLVGA